MQDKPTLMLVDDEPNILSALKRLLRQDGYTILAYEDARQALADMDGRPVDVILTDQRMPNMSGVEFLRRVRQSHPDTMRIVLSGYTELQFVTDAINEGAVYKFLTKPWDDEQLREHIRQAFRSKGIADENRRLNEALRAANAQLQVHAQELERQAGQLENTLDILQEVLQLIPWPILGVDDDGMIALANTASESLFGRQGMPLLGQTLSEILGAEASTWSGQASEAPQAMAVGGQRFSMVRRPMGRKSRSRGYLIALMPLETRP